MQDWWQGQVANGFAAFTGAVLTASIPVKEALLNELIAGYLAQASAPAAPAAASGTAPAIEPRQVVPLVRKITVQAGPGVVTLHVELAVDANAEGLADLKSR